MKSDYQCARWKFGYRCNKNAKTFWFNIQTLTKNTKKSAESATYLIKDAVKRFRNAIRSPLFPQFKKGLIASHLTSEELVLLRNVYGANTSDLYIENTLPLL